MNTYQTGSTLDSAHQLLKESRYSIGLKNAWPYMAMGLTASVLLLWFNLSALYPVGLVVAVCLTLVAQLYTPFIVGGSIVDRRVTKDGNNYRSFVGRIRPIIADLDLDVKAFQPGVQTHTSYGAYSENVARGFGGVLGVIQAKDGIGIFWRLHTDSRAGVVRLYRKERGHEWDQLIIPHEELQFVLDEDFPVKVKQLASNGKSRVRFKHAVQYKLVFEGGEIVTPVLDSIPGVKKENPGLFVDDFKPVPKKATKEKKDQYKPAIDFVSDVNERLANQAEAIEKALGQKVQISAFLPEKEQGQRLEDTFSFGGIEKDGQLHLAWACDIGRTVTIRRMVNQKPRHVAKVNNHYGTLDPIPVGEHYKYIAVLDGDVNLEASLTGVFVRSETKEVMEQRKQEAERRKILEEEAQSFVLPEVKHKMIDQLLQETLKDDESALGRARDRLDKALGYNLVTTDLGATLNGQEV